MTGTAHADGSARFVAERGYPELGPAISGHPVTRLADGAWFEEWLATASPEALIVSYADKRAGQRLQPMAERFASWERRYPPAIGPQKPGSSFTVETYLAMRARADVIERRVCELAAVTPAEVRRLAWTGRALALARVAAAGAEPAEAR